MEKKSLLIQGLEKYFDNMSEEQLEKYLKELGPCMEYGLMYGSIIKEHPILQKLNDYLSNVSEEQLQQDWDDLKQYQEMGGPTMDSVLNKHYYVYKDGHCLSDYNTFTEAYKHSKRIDGDVFIEDTEPICWNDMSDEDKADFFITLTRPKK